MTELPEEVRAHLAAQHLGGDSDPWRFVVLDCGARGYWLSGRSIGRLYEVFGRIGANDTRHLKHVDAQGLASKIHDGLHVVVFDNTDAPYALLPGDAYADSR